MPPPTITINYNTATQTLTADPPELEADRGAAVIWQPGENVNDIDSVSITQVYNPGGGQTYSGNQPAKNGNAPFVWVDPPNIQTATYEYVVGADVTTIGIRTLDPRIINKT
jgi:hypothetical protein